ncbi:MAG: hypothetical protein J7M25_08645 [Deltaproteobacteria bacterium]|nr:hypothetical protein [Deltaproteobacteria bacterium]
MKRSKGSIGFLFATILFSVALAVPALAQPATGQPGTQPGQPGTPPATPPTAQPSTTPATPPATQPATTPATPPATQPAAQPATQPAPRPVEKPRPAAKPRPVEKPRKTEAVVLTPVPVKGKAITPASSSGVVKPAIPPVKSSFGTLRILGLLSARFIMPLRGTFSSKYQTKKGGATGADQNMAVEMQRIRLILLGHLFSKNLKYVFQGDAVQKPFMLDVKFIYDLPWVPGLSLIFGRYLPNYTLMMPTLITRLETAEYPIYMTEGGYAPWRQMGLEVAYKKQLGSGKLAVYAGVFTGPKNGWTDDNNYKDVLARVEYGFNKGGARGLWFGVNTWVAFPHCSYDSGNLAASTCTEEDSVKNKADTDIKTGFMLKYVRRFNKSVGLNSMGEFVFRRFIPWAKNRDSYTGYAFWAHVGLPLGKWVEPLVRFDYLNVNKSMDKNNAWRITGGLNVFLEGIHSHFKIDYIYQKNGENYSGHTSWTDVKYGDNVLTDQTAKKDVHMFIIQINSEF